MCQLVCILVQDEYKPGDPPPPGRGYLAMQEWAEVQLMSGLRQAECPCCGRWRFPQELSKHWIAVRGFDNRGRVFVTSDRMCLECATERGLTNA